VFYLYLMLCTCVIAEFLELRLYVPCVALCKNLEFFTVQLLRNSRTFVLCDAMLRFY
jgi:hypothetical protein